MNCEDSRKYFHNYLDLEMKPRDAHALETHLKTCFHCKAELGVLQRAVRLTGELEIFSPSKGFNREILRELGFEFIPRWRRVVSFVSVILTGTWLLLFFPWVIRSIRVLPELIKTVLHFPAKLTFLTVFIRTLYEPSETLLNTGALVIRNIPYLYWLMVISASFLITILFVKTLASQWKEVNHVQHWS